MAWITAFDKTAGKPGAKAKIKPITFWLDDKDLR